jgi:hypothetical protein
MASKIAYQVIGGRIMPQVNLCFRIKLRQYIIGKLLPELNPPLIKGINIPDHALNKDFMLVHGD